MSQLSDQSILHLSVNQVQEIINSSILSSLTAYFQDNTTKQKETDINDDVEAPEAANILHLSMDRFYAIHKKTFNSTRPRKKLLFSRKELLSYMAGEKVILLNSAIKDAEDFRTTRLKTKLQAV